MAAPLRAAGLIIFRRYKGEIEYLLLQTSYGENHWTPPKGHVDPGEELKTTALRETEEEAGLNSNQFNITDFKSILNYEVKGRPKEVVYWLAELTNPEERVALSDEHQDFKWLKLEDACSLVGFDDLQKTLKDAHGYLVDS